MRSIFTGLQLAFTAALIGIFPGSTSLNHGQHDGLNIITRDVAIIGGGSTGTYAAIKLIDQGHSVIVVEATDRLGGHTETYHDPATGGRIDIGVEVFHDTDVVKKYFGHFNIELAKRHLFSAEGEIPTTNVNFAAGQLAESFVPPPPEDSRAAMQAYAYILSKYGYLKGGFDLPNPVPEELLIPFGEFVEKNGLQAMVQIAFGIGQGLGDILTLPTIYMMQIFGLDVLMNIQNGFLTTARGDNSEIYEKATVELLAKNSVLFNSRVSCADRNKRDKDGYLSVTIRTGNSPNGKVIRAKQILITIPPTLETLAPFNLDATEKSIFGRFKWVSYLTGILKNVGIPSNTNFANVNPANKYGLPKLPGLYGLYATIVPGLTALKYASTTRVSQRDAKKDILDTVAQLRRNKVITGAKEKPEFVAFAVHSPFELTVERADIEGGFYRRMYGLQGKRGTWWTGAAWFVQDSSLLWEFTERVLVRLMKEL